mmetsp:Transcript_59562/g.192723  ORF Transcript_59562/g.192723 Transcript_59562/m.192723 type:complete len:225 (+) Transcript_59562:68-742(+)
MARSSPSRNREHWRFRGGSSTLVLAQGSRVSTQPNCCHHRDRVPISQPSLTTPHCGTTGCAIVAQASARRPAGLAGPAERAAAPSCRRPWRPSPRPRSLPRGHPRPHPRVRPAPSRKRGPPRAAPSRPRPAQQPAVPSRSLQKGPQQVGQPRNPAPPQASSLPPCLPPRPPPRAQRSPRPWARRRAAPCPWSPKQRSWPEGSLVFVSSKPIPISRRPRSAPSRA